MEKIKLTEKEDRFYQDVLSFDVDEDYDARIRKLESLKFLTISLLDRKAIPDQRIKFFVNKDFQFGGIKKSRKEVFESNGTTGNEIFQHPHFIKYLKYFIEGAAIDEYLIKKIEEIHNRHSYSDDAIDEIYKYLKSNQYIPKDKSGRKKFSEEIFKLMVDLNIETTYCHQIRKKIKG